MEEKTIVVGPFECNCRIWVCRKTSQAVISDPGDDPSRILEAWTEMGRPRVVALVHTHGHLDHIGGTRGVWEGLKEIQEAPPEILLHSGDTFLYKILKKQGELFGFTYEEPLDLTRELKDGEVIRFGEENLEVRHTPGHSPGSVCLYSGKKVLSGDTLFQGSVGRTDLWGGDSDLMFESIRNRILTLPEDTPVCPGHGEDSWVGKERDSNPFLR